MRYPWVLFLLGVFVCVGCDQASKRAAELLLADYGVVSLAGDVIRFQLASNAGALLSLGADSPRLVREIVLLWLVPALLLVLVGYGLRSGWTSRRELMGLALIAGGGLGNWLDRLLNGGLVTDFVSLGLGPLRTGIFNVADLAVMGGVVLLMSVRRRRPPAAEIGE